MLSIIHSFLLSLLFTLHRTIMENIVLFESLSYNFITYNSKQVKSCKNKSVQHNNSIKIGLLFR